MAARWGHEIIGNLNQLPAIRRLVRNGAAELAPFLDGIAAYVREVVGKALGGGRSRG